MRRTTPAGRSLLLIWLIAALQGLVSLDVPIYHIWSFTTVCLATAWLSSYLAVPNIQLTRRPLQPVVAGTPLTYEVELRNHSQRAAYALSVTEMKLPAGISPVDEAASSMVPRLAPHSETVLSLQLQCTKRGHHPLSGLYAASSYPLGLFRGLSLHIQEAHATVYPAYSIPAAFHLPFDPSAAIPSKGQTKSHGRADESTDFAYIREYRHGDNPRHLHWASWARLGTPAIKVLQQEDAGPHVGLVLDTAAKSPREIDALESGISALAGIAAYLSGGGMGVDFFMAAQRLYRLSGHTPHARFAHLMNALAGVQAGQSAMDWTSIATHIFEQTPTCNTLVLIALDWSEATADFVTLLQDRGIGVRTIVIRQEPTSRALPLDPAEHLLHLQPGNPWPQTGGVASPSPWNGP